jgi:hypothetical protein
MEPAISSGARERRRAPRYRVNLPAGLLSDARLREGTVVDLSTLGCFVLADTDGLRPGDLVTIRLRLRAGAPNLRLGLGGVRRGGGWLRCRVLGLPHGRGPEAAPLAR